MSEFDKDYMKEADRFLVENKSMKLMMDFAQSLKGYEDFRAKIKETIGNEKPEKMKDFVKAFSKVDKAMAEIDKLLKKV
jgi:hypothetical protein